MMCKECKEIKQEKIRKVYLDELPKWENGGNKGRSNWSKSAGHNIKFQYDDIKGEVKIVGYDYPYLYIKYKNEDPFKINIWNFQRCALGKLLDKYTGEFKIEIGTTFKDDKRDITITDRKYERQHKYYKYKCNKCGFSCGEHYKNGEYKEEFWIEESGLLNGNGCACCNGKAVAQGINDIPTTAPWMIKYFVGGYEEACKYSQSSGQKIVSVCPDCGCIKDKEIFIYTIYKRHSIACFCGDGISYPNKLAFSLLEQLDIKFVPEYSPRWVKPKRYDFYFEFNNKKYILEMDGGWHKQDNNLSGKNVKHSEDIDDYKDKLAEEHGIKVIRIDCDKSELEYIKENILDSQLNELFDLINVDWNKCEEFALSNRVKVACELKKNNPDMTTKEIGQLMKLNRSTITKYLKKGTELGWCNYDPKEETFNGNSKSGKMNSKQVEVFKDGVSMGVFESCVILERRSEELFGVKLERSNISMVCNGKKNHHKGFMFKLI